MATPARASAEVRSRLGFSETMDQRPKFHANDTSRDVLNIVPREVTISDARRWPAPPSLDVEGFELHAHSSAVSDFTSKDELARLHGSEIEALLLRVTGADAVVVTGDGVLRFGEKSDQSGKHDNSRPARFVHIDVSDATAATFVARSKPDSGRTIARAAQYNVWRAITPPPQDVPLAVCDARSVSDEDLIHADAVFDRDGKILFTFEALLLRHSPGQRWVYFSDMSPDEVLIFKTKDTDPGKAHHVPHGAFDNPLRAPDTPPRASLEMRGIAYWYA